MDDPNAQNDPTARVQVPTQDVPATPPPVAPTSVPPAAPPTSSWVQPKPHKDGAPVASIIVGVVLLAIGLWFFADYTLGMDMPTIRWSQLWPLVLIGIGALVLLGARRDRR